VCRDTGSDCLNAPRSAWGCLLPAAPKVRLFADSGQAFSPDTHCGLKPPFGWPLTNSSERRQRTRLVERLEVGLARATPCLLLFLLFLLLFLAFARAAY
jgi:hypothetical protein